MGVLKTVGTHGCSEDASKIIFIKIKIQGPCGQYALLYGHKLKTGADVRTQLTSAIPNIKEI